MTCSKSGPQRDPTSHMSGDERKECHPRRPEEVSTSNQHQSQHPASSHHLLPYHSSHVCKFLCLSPFYWLHDLHVYLIYSSMIIYLSLGLQTGFIQTHSNFQTMQISHTSHTLPSICPLCHAPESGSHHGPHHPFSLIHLAHLCHCSGWGLGMAGGSGGRLIHMVEMWPWMVLKCLEWPRFICNFNKFMTLEQVP